MIKFSDTEKQEILSSIQGMAKEEFDKELGVIAAERILDFFQDKIGKKIYNKALDDIKSWMKKRTEDLEIDFDQKYL
ncbi:MAG: DUF2164 domain-containing protein [Candidatus Woesearchaeota archaeon]